MLFHRSLHFLPNMCIIRSLPLEDKNQLVPFEGHPFVLYATCSKSLLVFIQRGHKPSIISFLNSHTTFRPHEKHTCEANTNLDVFSSSYAHKPPWSWSTYIQDLLGVSWSTQQHARRWWQRWCVGRRCDVAAAASKNTHHSEHTTLITWCRRERIRCERWKT